MGGSSGKRYGAPKVAAGGTPRGLPPGSSRGPVTSTDDFAARARKAVAALPVPKGGQSVSAVAFGREKVFLHAVRKKMGLSKPEFDRWAVAANREGKITMSRFDLRGAATVVRGQARGNRFMKIIDKQGISDRGSEFNFIHR